MEMHGAGKMVQGLGVLSVDPGSVLRSTSSGSRQPAIPVLGDTVPISVSVTPAHKKCTYTHSGIHTYTFTQKINKF